MISKILFGQGLVDAGLGDPSKDSSTPDVVVVLNPGYIWVGGNPAKKATFKREEHGGFSNDDTHVALIVGGGAIDQGLQGTSVDTAVKTTQIAVTVLEALGLDPSKLQGANKEGTVALPGLGLPVGVNHTLDAGDHSGRIVVATFVDPDNVTAAFFTAVINWGDGSTSHGQVIQGLNHTFSVVGQHTYHDTGDFTGSVTITDKKENSSTAAFQVKVVQDEKEGGKHHEQRIDLLTMLDGLDSAENRPGKHRSWLW